MLSLAQVYVPPHPLIKHWVAVLRNKQTPDVIFRSAAAELGRILIYEAARDWLPTIDAQVCCLQRAGGVRGWWAVT